MSKVEEIIKKSKESSSGRKTQNNEEYSKILIAVLTDEDYVTKDLEEFQDGAVIIKDKHIASGFLKYAVSAFKQAGMSEEEAKIAAKNLKITRDVADALKDAVRESDYIAIHECGHKIKLFKKPGLEVNLFIADVKEASRPNPKVLGERVIIGARQKVRAQHVIHDFQRTRLGVDGKPKK